MKFSSSYGCYSFCHALTIHDTMILCRPHEFVGEKDEISIAWDLLGEPSIFITVSPDPVLSENWKHDSISEQEKQFTKYLIKDYKKNANKTLSLYIDNREIERHFAYGYYRHGNLLPHIYILVWLKKDKP